MPRTPVLAAIVLALAAVTVHAQSGAPGGHKRMVTCTHTASGATVQTANPEVLGEAFSCPPPKVARAAPKAQFGEGDPPAPGLDTRPTPRGANASCPSSVTLIVKSSNYNGPFDVELRRGKRPGSLRLDGGSIIGSSGTLRFTNICRGANYFFAFGPGDSNEISVTRYFEVINNGESYSKPTITVYYSRVSGDGSQSVQTVSKKSL